MSQKILTVLMAGQILGRVEQSKHGKLRFVYDEVWRASSSSVPLSLSMPLVMREHEGPAVKAFLSGLLPDNRKVLDAWGRRFHVSARNPFALLAQIGEDCAGAVQFVREERLDAVLDDKSWEVDWLDDAEIEVRLEALRRDQSAWRSPNDSGQFSLAGAQAKTALLRQDGKWGIPSGRAPTTHILKPPLADFAGHLENVHFCLLLARALSIPAVTSKVMQFGKEVAIVVERYDRILTGELSASAAEKAARASNDPDPLTAAQQHANAASRAKMFAELNKTQPILRLHQEDLCQALGIEPTLKYQNEGGPSPAQIAELLQAHSSNPSEDLRTFVDALAFNWLVAGTDAHAKNYSVLHGGGGRVRLAPLYDLASAVPYDDLDPQRITLAMKVGSKYRIRDVTGKQWKDLAEEVQLDPGETIARVTAMARQMPEAVKEIGNRLHDDWLAHDCIQRLVEGLPKRAEDCLARLERE